MKYTALLAALAAILIAKQSANAQGALTPPGAPTESQKSLQEIYDAIQSARADFEAAKSDFALLVQQAVPSAPGMVTVLGGTLPQGSGQPGHKVQTFYIGKYEVIWSEWQQVRAWALNNGYTDLPEAQGDGDNYPVRNVSWYDAVKWSNAKSEKEGLDPVYKVDGSVYRTGDIFPKFDSLANGYRLPTEEEWEWAAIGGVFSEGYTFSGSNNLDDVAWHEGNANNAPQIVGQKQANELDIFDMSGNIYEWSWAIWENPNLQGLEGGSYVSEAFFCRPAYRGQDQHPGLRSLDLGFRLARSY
jgi:formylglycine-generating enzyme required for sulfatase activity